MDRSAPSVAVPEDMAASEPAARPRRAGWLAVLPGAVMFVLAVAEGADLVMSHRDVLWQMQDLGVYWSAGGIVRASGDVYDWVSVDGLPFTYPPLAAGVFAVVSFIPFATLKWLVVLMDLASLLGVVWVTWGAVGQRRSWERVGATLLVAGAALWTEPVLQTVHFGQINLILILVIVADLVAPDERRWKGVGVGVAAGFKLTPLIFIGYLVVTRRFRAAATAAATFAATVALGFLVLPEASVRYWFGGLFANSGRLEPQYLANQSVYGMLVRFFHDPDAARPYWLAAAVLVGVAGLALAGWAAHRGHAVIGILTCALTALLVSPISWSHHWAWIAPALVVATHYCRPGGSPLRVLGLPLLFFVFNGVLGNNGLIWIPPVGSHREYSWHGADHLVGNLYVLVGLAVLALTALVLVRQARSTSPRIRPVDTDLV